MTCWIPADAFQGFSGEITLIPGDKSISHRVVILGSISEGTGRYTNFLCSEDCLNTVRIMQQLGIDIQLKDTDIIIKGQGLFGLSAPQNILDVGNSGTAIRLLSGVLSAQSFSSQITGDASIQKRPMSRILAPLRLMRAHIRGMDGQNPDDAYPPLSFVGGSQLSAISYAMPMASAQVKSALLLAGLYANGVMSIQEPLPSRDHTEYLLRFLGADLKVHNHTITMPGGQHLRHPDTQGVYRIPSDPSSAIFLLALSICSKKVSISIPNVGLNPTRAHVFSVLQRMGAALLISQQSDALLLEPQGTITIEGKSLQNTTISPSEVPYLIDEFPILAVIARFSKGRFVVTGAEELRYKESDRLLAIERLVRTIGGSIELTADGFEIQGGGDCTTFEFDSGGDHRLAMSAIIAACIGGVSATISNCDCIATSFPTFFSCLDKLNIKYQR